MPGLLSIIDGVPVETPGLEKVSSDTVSAPYSNIPPDVWAAMSYKDKMKEAMKTPAPVHPLTVDGKSIYDIISGHDPIVYVDPIPEDTMRMYLSDRLPIAPNRKRDIKRLLQTIIMFYRGVKRIEIQKRVYMNSQQFNILAYEFLSMRVYARWFEGRMWLNSAKDKIDVGGMLAGVQSGIMFKDLVSDCHFDNMNQLIDILSYYVGLDFSDNRNWLVEDFGGWD